MFDMVWLDPFAHKRSYLFVIGGYVHILRESLEEAKVVFLLPGDSSPMSLIVSQLKELRFHKHLLIALLDGCNFLWGIEPSSLRVFLFFL